MPLGPRGRRLAIALLMLAAVTVLPAWTARRLAQRWSGEDGDGPWDALREEGEEGGGTQGQGGKMEEEKARTSGTDEERPRSYHKRVAPRPGKGAGEAGPMDSDRRFWNSKLAQKRAFKRLDNQVKEIRRKQEDAIATAVSNEFDSELREFAEKSSAAIARRDERAKASDWALSRKIGEQRESRANSGDADDEPDSATEALKRMREVARKARQQANVALRQSDMGILDSERATNLAETAIPLSISAVRAVSAAAKALNKKPEEYDSRVRELTKSRLDAPSSRMARATDPAEREEVWKSELASLLRIKRGDVDAETVVDIDPIDGEKHAIGAHVFLCLDESDVTSLVKALSDIVVSLAAKQGGRIKRWGKTAKPVQRSAEELSIHVITQRSLVDAYTAVVSQNFAYLNIEVVPEKTEVHSGPLHVRVSLPEWTVGKRPRGLRACRRVKIAPNDVREADARADMRFGVIREIAREEWS